MGVLDIDARRRRALATLEPRTEDQLDGWLRVVLDIEVPRRAMIEGHTAPFEYLAHTFFGIGAGPRDCAVWAARGAGKTFYAALSTALDLIFRPGIEVRLLGGSLEQSSRMHEHLVVLFGRPELARLIAKPARRNLTAKRLRLVNRSKAEILAQSHTSVRGARPQVLRCDEVELFDPEVWRAAQLMTRSKRCGRTMVRGRVEALSTWHLPHGLMASLVGEGAPPAARRIFKWGVVDVLEACPQGRPCAGCALQPECAGRAKHGRGHVSIDDALALKQRSDRATWEAEMLCLRPKRTDAVFPEFDRGRHVVAPHAPEGAASFIAGMDFGFRAPTVILFATVDARDVVHVLDEHVAAGVVIDEHIEAIRRSPFVHSDGLPEWIGVDPAGRQRNEQTGISTIAILRRAGLTVRARPTALEAGLRLVRARLAPATEAAPRLLIHPRCRQLIESLETYHYPTHRPDVNVPVKDGPDHAVDALRYMLINLEPRSPVRMARYI